MAKNQIKSTLHKSNFNMTKVKGLLRTRFKKMFFFFSIVLNKNIMQFDDKDNMKKQPG